MQQIVQKNQSLINLLKDAELNKEDLFNNYSTVLSIFRSLTELSQQLLLRFLYVGYCVKQSQLEEHIQLDNSSNRNQFDRSKQELLEFRIMKKDQEQYQFDSIFMNNLKYIIINGLQNPIVYQDSMSQNEDRIYKYSKDNWRNIHHFIVGMETQKGLDKSTNLFKVLENSQLIQPNQIGISGNITKQGFQFILCSTSEQINFFLSEYIRFLKQKVQKIEKIINFILDLNLCDTKMTLIPQIQKNQNRIPFSTIENQIIKDFQQIGLIWKHSNTEFQITQLMSNISYESSKVDLDFKADFIIETNFRLYAYQVSDFIVKLLQHFCQINYVFPHKVICTINRECVIKAFRNNITADQLITFLNKNIDISKYKKINDQQQKKIQLQSIQSVEQSKKLEYLKIFQKINENDQQIFLPQNVIQQLKLWEAEKNINYSEQAIKENNI